MFGIPLEKETMFDKLRFFVLTTVHASEDWFFWAFFYVVVMVIMGVSPASARTNKFSYATLAMPWFPQYQC